MLPALVPVAPLGWASGVLGLHTQSNVPGKLWKPAAMTKGLKSIKPRPLVLAGDTHWGPSHLPPVSSGGSGEGCFPQDRV